MSVLTGHQSPLKLGLLICFIPKYCYLKNHSVRPMAIQLAKLHCIKNSVRHYIYNIYSEYNYNYIYNFTIYVFVYLFTHCRLLASVVSFCRELCYSLLGPLLLYLFQFNLLLIHFKFNIVLLKFSIVYIQFNVVYWFDFQK